MLTEGVREDAVISLLKSVISGSEYEGKVFIAGGYVRDEVLGNQPKDIDLVVNMPGGGIAFAEYLTRRIGNYKEGSNPVIYPRFGTAKVHFNGIVHNGVDLTGMDVECVAPRVEAYNPDSRKPVVSAGTLKQDVERRDFTVNSLLKNLSTDEVEDLTGLGREDLTTGILRTPLDPDIIFDEDPLRMLRAIRFAVKYGWQFAPGLEQAIAKNASRLGIISRERVRDELQKMLVSADPKRAVQIMMDTGLIEFVHPKLADALRKSVGMTQNRYHSHDVYNHIMEVLAHSSPGVPERLAALLHDIGKPYTRTPHEKNPGEFQFLGHEDESVKLTFEIMQDLKFPSDVIKRVVSAVGAHMGMKDPQGSSDRAVKRWVRGIHKHVPEAEAAAQALDTALDLLRADAMGHTHKGDDPGGVNYLRQRINDIGAAEAEQLRQTVVTGHDLKNVFGMKPGPEFKPILDFVQDLVDGNPGISKEDALEAVRAKFF